MECLVGIQFRNFVMIAADQTRASSIIVIKDDDEKFYKISEKLVMAIVGESGDTTQFAEYIAKNIQLYKMRNGYEMGPDAAAHFTRKNLADSLRSRSPYNVNMLLGGWDKETGPSLHFIDYLASCVKVPYAAHGYGGWLTLSIMDKGHYMDLSEEEAYKLMEKCVAEIQKRLIINLPNFEVVVVNKDGIKHMPRIKAIQDKTVKDKAATDKAAKSLKDK